MTHGVGHSADQRVPGAGVDCHAAAADAAGAADSSHGSSGRMVLPDRIELSTSPLPRECSTTELLQRRGLFP